MVAAGGAAAGPLLDVFRTPDFNVASFVRDATSQGQDRLRRLTQQLEDCLSYLDEELQREIIACHEELLLSAGSVGDLDGQLGEVKAMVSTLKASAARMRSEVLSPFADVKRRTTLLERMQAVSVLIRKLRSFLSDARKLHTQMEAPTKDFSKAAHTLHELEAVLGECGLARVDVLRAEVAWIRDTGLRVRRQAEDDLRSGTKQGNQISLSVALQVFFNLQCLQPQLLRMLTEMLAEFTAAPLMPGLGFQQSLEVNLQILVAQTQRIYLLDELIRSKRDPLTHRSFSSVMEEGGGIQGSSSLVKHFWGECTLALKAKFTKLSQDRGARKVLLADVPKILNSLAEAADKVNVMSRGRGQALKTAEREALCAVVADLRTEYLLESIRRVTEPVEMMLPEKLLASLTAAGERLPTGGQASMGANLGAGDGGVADELPTSHDVRRYVQLLAAELERGECCQEHLQKETVRTVRSSVVLFATRLEQVMDFSSIEIQCFANESLLLLRASLPLPTAGHARNARIFGIAHHTLSALKEFIPARFQALVVTEQVHATLQQTQSAIVAPTFAALRRAMLLSFVRALAGAEERGADGSPAILAASQACAHVGKYHFALFGTGQLLPYMKDLCIAIMRSYVSAATLRKPCEEKARSEVLQDMQTVETALSSLDSDFQGHASHEAGVFREFRKLLFARPLASVDFDALVNVIPVHVLLTFLVHQLSPEVPTLPVFLGMEPAKFLESTLLPLWDGDSVALASFNSSVADLSDRHGLDPTESTAIAFIVTHSA